jgi:hypothetical protein
MKRVAALLSFLVVGLVGSMTFGHIEPQSGTGADDDTLGRRVDGAQLEYVSTIHAFFKALSETGTPGGIVRTIGCEGDGTVQQWQPLGSSLRDVLDGIVYANPRYRWTVENGVINAIPIGGEPELLKTHIREFKMQNAISPNSTLSELFSTTEVKASLDRLGLNEALKAGSFPPSKVRKVGLTLQYNNVTLREALNAIARAFGNTVWLYREHHCDGRAEYEIDFIVE